MIVWIGLPDLESGTKPACVICGLPLPTSAITCIFCMLLRSCAPGPDTWFCTFVGRASNCLRRLARASTAS